MTRIGRDADDCLVRVAVEMPLGHPRRPQSCLIVTALRQRLTLASEGHRECQEAPMRITPIHSAKRQSSRTKLTHAGAVAAMVVLTVGLAALGSAASAVAQDAEMAKVDYPTGYRDWTHVKSMVIQPVRGSKSEGGTDRRSAAFTLLCTQEK